jgi:hypothetical protein
MSEWVPYGAVLILVLPIMGGEFDKFSSAHPNSAGVTV